MITLEADYLIIGCGAMGMAFTDVLLGETDATVVIVDQRGRPGGHWNDAYPSRQDDLDHASGFMDARMGSISARVLPSGTGAPFCLNWMLRTPMREDRCGQSQC